MTQAKESDALKAALEPKFTITDDIFVEVRGLVGSLVYLFQTAPDSGLESQLTMTPEAALRLVDELSARLSRPTQPASGAEVREMCAKVAEDYAQLRNEDDVLVHQRLCILAAEEIAAAIRALPIPEAGAGEELPYQSDDWKLRGYPSAAAEIEDMADVGRALMQAIEKDYADDPFVKGWHPADCPTEIVGDLLSALHEAAAPQPQQAVEAVAWNTMDSAPKDGTRINLCWREVGGLSAHVELGKFSPSRGWCNTYGNAFSGDPDYWMALPNPPAPKVEGEG